MKPFTLDSFYRSKIWQGFVAQLRLERVNDAGELICEHCGKPIVSKYDCIGHHKKELTEENVNDMTISLNPANVALIHFRCHNAIHHRFQGGSQEVYLVYGPPCAGKNTWVESACEPDDLIVDIDRIWEALCYSDKYHKPNRIKANVFAVVEDLLDQVKIRKGMWRSAFIIGGFPLRTDRDRICSTLRAKEIYISESKEICLARAKTEAWKTYIEEWFEDYVE